jgi:hypothetical protein
MHFHIKRTSYHGFGECGVIYLPICLNPFSYGYECSGRQDGQLQEKSYCNGLAKSEQLTLWLPATASAVRSDERTVTFLW